MATDAERVTVEQVRRECPTAPRWEVVAGELRELTPSSFYHGRVVSTLHHHLDGHVRARRLGVVTAAETGFVIARDPDTLQAPDVGFVRFDRVPEGDPGFFEGPPDLAAEVVSPSDRPREIQEKTARWIAAGTRLVWVIWPDTRSVTVHRPDGEAAIRHEGDRLDGGAVVPGFSCEVAALFP